MRKEEIVKVEILTSEVNDSHCSEWCKFLVDINLERYCVLFDESISMIEDNDYRPRCKQCKTIFDIGDIK